MFTRISKNVFWGPPNSKSLRWRIFFGEKYPNFEYMKGELIVIVDTFSKMGRKDDTESLVGEE